MSEITNEQLSALCGVAGWNSYDARDKLIWLFYDAEGKEVFPATNRDDAHELLRGILLTPLPKACTDGRAARGK